MANYTTNLEWYFQDEGSCIAIKGRDGYGSLIATMDNYPHKEAHTFAHYNRANAVLICKAPVMYRLLKDIVRFHDLKINGEIEELLKEIDNA